MKESSATAFDSAALDYDDQFTNSWVGRSQRNLVWKYLSGRIEQSANLSVLELNCGTGEDACWLAQRGHRVVATDISEAMLDISRKKIKARELSNVETIVSDMKILKQKLPNRKFDLVFSNFGGLNCLSPEEIKHLSNELHDMLEIDGRMIFVVMGRKCIWENIYFRLKGKKKDANRRRESSPAAANVGSSKLMTWYYSPTELSALLQPSFEIKKIKPVGLFIPPSYFEDKLKEKNFLKKTLLFLEQTFQNFSAFSNFADHYLIEFRKLN